MTAVTTDAITRLTREFDFHDPAYTPDVAEVVNRQLREEAPVSYSPAHGGMWILSRYEDVRAALKDHATFSSASGVHFPRADGMPKFSPIDYDPPEHGRIRELMAAPVTPEAVRRRTPALRELAAELVEPVVRRGYGDLAADIAQPFAIRSLGLAIGLSAQGQDRVREMTRTMWTFISADKDASKFWPAFHDLLFDEIQRVRREPGPYYLSDLVNTPVDGALLDEQTLYSIIVSFCVAGHDNTMNTLSRLLWLLASRPALQERLRAEPALRPAVAEEALRRWAPTDRFTRVTTRDVTVDGVTIPRGARVVLLFDGANRDPAKFREPERFDPERPHVRQHMSFGHGIHHCMGIHLARAEFEAVLTELARHPRFRLTDQPHRHFENGRHVMFDAVRVRFDPPALSPVDTDPDSPWGGAR